MKARVRLLAYGAIGPSCLVAALLFRDVDLRLTLAVGVAAAFVCSTLALLVRTDEMRGQQNTLTAELGRLKDLNDVHDSMTGRRQRSRRADRWVDDVPYWPGQPPQQRDADQ